MDKIKELLENIQIVRENHLNNLDFISYNFSFGEIYLKKNLINDCVIEVYYNGTYYLVDAKNIPRLFLNLLTYSVLVHKDKDLPLLVEFFKIVVCAMGTLDIYLVDSIGLLLIQIQKLDKISDINTLHILFSFILTSMQDYFLKLD
jgi:hypothetical protein